MENKNKNSDDGWNPAEYEIYSKEDKDDSPDEIFEEMPVKQPRKKKISFVTVIAVLVLIAAIVAGVFLLKDRIFSGENNQGNSNNQGVGISNSVRVTFPEGYTVYQMAQLLEEKEVCSAQAFLEAANTPVDGIEIQNADDRVFLLEGYLFPDTYDFYVGESAASVVNRFIQNYKSKISEEDEKQAQSLGYTMDEMLTLASIIQKECDADIAECRNVSSVFHNRLEQSKESYLGSDVTYFYLKNMADYLGGSESEKFDKYLLDYYTYSPYRKGLPTGPICNPGLKAIEAALNPAETDYLFFLTDKSGENFYYAQTYEQHLKNGEEAGLN